MWRCPAATCLQWVLCALLGEMRNDGRIFFLFSQKSSQFGLLSTAWWWQQPLSLVSRSQKQFSITLIKMCLNIYSEAHFRQFIILPQHAACKEHSAKQRPCNPGGWTWADSRSHWQKEKQRQREHMALLGIKCYEGLWLRRGWEVRERKE